MKKLIKNKIIKCFKYFNFFIFQILFLSALLGTMIGTQRFWIGYHAADLCSNEQLIAERYDLELYEMTISGDIHTLSECYRIGLKQLITGFYTTATSMILLGYFLCVNIVLWRQKWLK